MKEAVMAEMGREELREWRGRVLYHDNIQIAGSMARRCVDGEA